MILFLPVPKTPEEWLESTKTEIAITTSEAHKWIRSLLADRDALVRYVRLLDGYGPYGNPEFVVELEEVRQALSQELREEIDDVK